MAERTLRLKRMGSFQRQRRCAKSTCEKLLATDVGGLVVKRVAANKVDPQQGSRSASLNNVHQLFGSAYFLPADSLDNVVAIDVCLVQRCSPRHVLHAHPHTVGVLPCRESRCGDT